MAKMDEKIYVTDEMLDTPAQRAVRSAVAALPEDTPSLAWRSELNERLRASAVQPKRARWSPFVWGPAFGLGVAGALSILMLNRAPITTRPTTPSQSAGVEAMLVSAHLESVRTADIVGTGITPEEASLGATVQNEADETPIEVDLESL